MENRVRQAFDSVRANEETKARTKAFVEQKREEYHRANRPAVRYRRFAVAAASVLVILCSFFGYWLYFTQTAAISIEINPSLNLGINRFDKVISVTGMNEDGKELANSLDIRFMDCAQAIDAILESEVEQLLNEGETLAITVAGSDQGQCGRLFSEVERCTQGEENACCYLADPQEMAAAENAGLSYGKYKAFLELQELDADVIPQDLQGMTMRQIREWIEELKNGDETETEGDFSPGNRPGAGIGGGNGAGAGNGSGNGAGGSGMHRWDMRQS